MPFWVTEFGWDTAPAVAAFADCVLEWVTISVVALITYQFHLDSIGWGLVPIVGVLLIRPQGLFGARLREDAAT